jgi:transcriptional regulator with XRE-family HTH domain
MLILYHYVYFGEAIMEDEKIFGIRLRELRTQAGMTLRELAGKVGVNFTYLSKIENGALPPPSEKVIRQLAEVLNADRDELLALAGIIPSDLAEILKDPKLRERLRAEKSRKDTKTSARKMLTIPRLSLPFKGYYRLALPVFLVVVLAASLWFASPTQALEIEITNPATGVLGSTYTFTVTVSIEDNELLPLQQINVAIYKENDPATYKATLADLPLNTRAVAAHAITEGAGSGTATVGAAADAAWGSAAIGAGYVYWEGQGYTFAPVVGGYGYQGGIGTTSITYTIRWVSPTNWPAGTYKIDTVLVSSPKTPGGGTTFTKTSSGFTLAAGGGWVPQPPPTPTPTEAAPETQTTDVSDNIDTTTKQFTSDIHITTSDGNVTLDINEGARGETSTGEALTEITITEQPDPPAPPANSNSVALTYDLGPDGAQFPDGITLTLTYDPDTVIEDGTLVICYYDGTDWVELPGPYVIDTVNNTISTTIYHFTQYSVFENVTPASFSVSDLAISATEVEIGENVIIGVTVANSGGVASTYDVALKIDGTTADTETVTVAGRSSQAVTFTTSFSADGNYTISIDDLSGQVTVSTAEPTATTPEPTATAPEPTATTPEPTATAPEPTATAPEPTTTAPVVEPEPGANWWLIGGIIAAVIVIGAITWIVIARRRSY